MKFVVSTFVAALGVAKGSSCTYTGPAREGLYVKCARLKAVVFCEKNAENRMSILNA